MSALQPLFALMNVKPCKLTREERLILEAELFARICDELKENYRERFRNYFCLMKFTTEMENKMLDESFISLIINDILSTNEYTLQGIARYANIHPDVVEELASGFNNDPTARCLRKAIELHRSVRKELYQGVMKKVVAEYLSL